MGSRQVQCPPRTSRQSLWSNLRKITSRCEFTQPRQHPVFRRKYRFISFRIHREHLLGGGPTTRSPRTRPPPPRRWTAPRPPSCCRTARSGSGGHRRRCWTALWPWKCRWPPCGRPHRRRGRPPQSSRRRLYRWVLKESIDMPSSVFSRPSSKLVIHS